ncbi:MAG: TIGR03936 family radical SAM-associated protein, partial [Clostridia bacterium]|nr:TIGR03936 family radical SAM-associated protein [Clostridia bacterium]
MKMLVIFEKSERLRHIGHLDLMRAMQRALRRSGLPIAFSQGFNPHVLLNFAAPLSVGMPGKR